MQAKYTPLRFPFFLSVIVGFLNNIPMNRQVKPLKFQGGGIGVGPGIKELSSQF
jgi:hypothetical protein